MNPQTILKNLFIFAIGLTCLSCVFNHHKDCLALKISNKERNKIVEKFRNQSVYKRGKIITLLVYKNELKNSFYFQQKKDGRNFSLELISDSLEFKPALDFDPLNSTESEEHNIKNLIEVYTHNLVSRMDSLKIDGFTSEFSHLGIDLKLYFKDYSSLFYISDLEKISNSHWKAFINNNAEKIDQHWYYYISDQDR